MTNCASTILLAATNHTHDREQSARQTGASGSASRTPLFVFKCGSSRNDLLLERSRARRTLSLVGKPPTPNKSRCAHSNWLAGLAGFASNMFLPRTGRPEFMIEARSSIYAHTTHTHKRQCIGGSLEVGPICAHMWI